jgi:hypothetical protein
MDLRLTQLKVLLKRLIFALNFKCNENGFNEIIYFDIMQSIPFIVDEVIVNTRL